MADRATELYGHLWAFKYAPLHAAERAKEEERRTIDFLAGARPVSVFRLRPITAYDLLVLDGIGSPLVGATPCATTPEELAFFLWHQREPVRSWLPESWQAGRFSAYCVKRYIAKDGKATGEFIHDLGCAVEFVAETFADSEVPQKIDLATGQPAGGRALGTSWLSTLIMRMACATGWSEPEIMSLPLGRLWQYLRDIRARENPGGTLAGNAADKHASDCLAEVNEIMARERNEKQTT